LLHRVYIYIQVKYAHTAEDKESYFFGTLNIVLVETQIRVDY